MTAGQTSRARGFSPSPSPTPKGPAQSCELVYRIPLRALSATMSFGFSRLTIAACGVLIRVPFIDLREASASNKPAPAAPGRPRTSSV
jgi:hypothetical protein